MPESRHRLYVSRCSSYTNTYHSLVILCEVPPLISLPYTKGVARQSSKLWRATFILWVSLYCYDVLVGNYRYGVVVNLDQLGIRPSQILYTESDLTYDFAFRTLAKKAQIKREGVLEVSTDTQARAIFQYQGLDPLDSKRWFFVVNTSRISSKLLRPLLKTAETDDASFYLFNTSSGRDFFRVKELAGGSTTTMFTRTYSRDDISFILADTPVENQVKETLMKGYRAELESPFKIMEYLDEGYEIQKPKDVTALLGVSSMMTSRTVYEMLQTVKSKNTRIRKVMPSLIAGESKAGAMKYRRDLANAAKDLFDLKLLVHMGKIYKTVPQDLPKGFDYKRIVRNSYLLSSGKLADIPLVRIQRMWLELSDKNVWYSRADMLRWLYCWYS